VRFLCGDGFEPLQGERFDLIVSNPPYLAYEEASSLAPELAHEPREALFADARGTALLRRIASQAQDFLEDSGAIAVELTPQQAPEMTQWLVEAGFVRPESHRDLAGRIRVVAAERRDGHALEVAESERD
jgi:release factor glutamine methyltransferase